ncbi:MAG: metalloregulator ArsR/SmtB family transcription factor [Acidobacteriota bacterium]
MTTEASTTSCAELLRALADGTRLSVLRELQDGPRTVAEINEQLQLEQSLLSHHLRVLREHGLVSSERRGKGVLYRLTRDDDRAPGELDLGCCRLNFEDPA